jgi:hypothetical protein
MSGVGEAEQPRMQVVQVVLVGADDVVYVVATLGGTDWIRRLECVFENVGEMYIRCGFGVEWLGLCFCVIFVL